MSAAPPRIWVLLGSRVGDNNQLLALAEALGLPFETQTMHYRRLWALWLRLFPASPVLLTSASRAALQPPWPDLVIGIGRRSVAVARWIKRKSGGRTRIVRLGNPRADPRWFDLVLTTPQYPVAPAPNVQLLPLSMSRHRAAPEVRPDEVEWLEAMPRPHLLLSLGGATRFWWLADADIAKAAIKLANRADAAGGTLIVVGSPRTEARAFDTIRRAIGQPSHVHLLPTAPMRYAVLMDDADEHFVTADSVSMISEAVLTGKPVGLIPVELDDEGQRRLGRAGLSREFRDLRRFWAHLEENRLCGTIDQPVSGRIDDPVELAAAAVKRLLDSSVA